MNSSYTSSSKPTFMEISECKNVLAWNLIWFCSETLKKPRNHADIGYIWFTWWLLKLIYEYFISLIPLSGLTNMESEWLLSWLTGGGAILTWEPQSLILGVRSAVPGAAKCFGIWFYYCFLTVFSLFSFNDCEISSGNKNSMPSS